MKVIGDRDGMGAQLIAGVVTDREAGRMQVEVAAMIVLVGELEVAAGALGALPRMRFESVAAQLGLADRAALQTRFDRAVEIIEGLLDGGDRYAVKTGEPRRRGRGERDAARRFDG